VLKQLLCVLLVDEERQAAESVFLDGELLPRLVKFLSQLRDYRITRSQFGPLLLPQQLLY
jgi:hypothetical protein